MSTEADVHPTLRDAIDEVYIAIHKPDCYHLTDECQRLNNASGVVSRDLDDVADLGVCSHCTRNPDATPPEDNHIHNKPGKVPGVTRDVVLKGTQFENLLIGAGRIGPRYDREAWAVIVLLGRLGLRRGELAHFDASWVDETKQMVQVPAYDPCEKGRDGGLCGYCSQCVDQMLSHDDDRCRDDVAETYWQPKTEASVRSIPYGWSTRTTAAVEYLVDEHGGWPYSYGTVEYRLDRALEEAPGLKPESTTPHGLRGTAASYHAGNGVEWQALKTMMGWRENDTPKAYLAIDGAMTRRALTEVYG